jgi:hypothetical protein
MFRCFKRNQIIANKPRRSNGIYEIADLLRNPPPLHAVQALDKNKDGSLTRAEFCANLKALVCLRTCTCTAQARSDRFMNTLACYAEHCLHSRALAPYSSNVCQNV